MKRTMIAILAAWQPLATSGPTAQAQANVTIPFGFHADSVVMPAGTCRIEFPMPTAISLQSLDGHNYVSLLATTNRGRHKTSQGLGELPGSRETRRKALAFPAGV